MYFYVLFLKLDFDVHCVLFYPSKLNFGNELIQLGVTNPRPLLALKHFRKDLIK